MKMSVTLSDLSAVEAAMVVNTFGGSAGNASPSTVPSQTAAPPPPTATPVNAPPPPATAPTTPPPQAPVVPAAPPAPPPPAAPAGASNPKITDVMAKMQAYASTHKAAGVKRVLGMLNISAITQATDPQLDWLSQAFASMATPEVLGAK